jgi:hypothetical protein
VSAKIAESQWKMIFFGDAGAVDIRAGAKNPASGFAAMQMRRHSDGGEKNLHE